jgi:hypothetical protein
MPSIILGPLHGDQPSLGTALLAIGAGLAGFASIMINVVLRGRRDFSWVTFAFLCVVLLFLTILGVTQLLKVW